MIQKNELIELGFTAHHTDDDFMFYEKLLTSKDWMTAEESKDGYCVSVGELDGHITDASDLKQLIEIFNRANNDKN